MALLLSETGSDASTNSLPRADSLVDEPGAFEGPEKTLEVCFLPGAGDIRGCRGLTRAQARLYPRGGAVYYFLTDVQRALG